MDRSKFIKSVCFLLFAGIPSARLLSTSASDGTVLPCFRRTTIKFPTGKTFLDFQLDQSAWIDTSQWLACIELAKRDGLLLEMRREVYEDRVVYLYSFPSYQDHDVFVQKAEGVSCFSSMARANLGYNVKVEIIS